MKKLRSLWVGVGAFVVGSVLVAYAAVPVNTIGSGLSLSTSGTLTNTLTTGASTSQVIIGGTGSGVTQNLFLQSNANTNGNVIVSGPWLSVQKSLPSDVVTFRAHNQSNTANSFARIIASVAGSSAADPSLQMEIAGVESWNFGVDNSDSDTFKLSHDTQGTLDTGTVLRVDTTGRMALSDTGVTPATGEQLLVATTIDDALTVSLKNASTGTQASQRFRTTNNAGSIGDFALYNSTHSNTAFANRLSINAYDPADAIQFMCTKSSCFQRWIVAGTGDSAEAMRLTSGGLGIGTTPNSSYKLHVATTGANTAFAVVDQKTASVDASAQIVAQADNGTKTTDLRMYNASATGTLAGYSRASMSAVYNVGGTRMLIGSSSGPLHLIASASEKVRIPNSNPTSGQASLLVEVNDGSVTSIRQVTVGSSDSGGTGFRVLRVPN